MQEINFNSPFGEWRIRTCPPPPDLAYFVESFAEIYGVVGYGHEKILPRASVEFMINLGPPHIALSGSDGDTQIDCQNAWLAGIRDTPIITAPAESCSSFTTHFVTASIKPEGVFGLFGIEAESTTGLIVDSEDLLGHKAHLLRERVGNSASTITRFNTLANFFRSEQSARSKQVSTEAIWAMERTRNLYGNVKIEDLCGDLGISRKHLNKLYRSATGLSPKTYARLIRFRSVIDKIQDPGDTWADIASDSGYFDQAHLIRDFRLFAGESPGSFLDNCSPDGESINYEDRLKN